MAKTAEPRSVKVYVDEAGRSPFNDRFDGLDAVSAARIVRALSQLERGGGDLKPVGEGVSELRIDTGPGYRVYFGQDGLRLVILLCGGSKRRQSADIARARALWSEYRARRTRR